jgi:hypothetical protein
VAGDEAQAPLLKRLKRLGRAATREPDTPTPGLRSTESRGLLVFGDVRGRASQDLGRRPLPPLSHSLALALALALALSDAHTEAYPPTLQSTLDRPEAFPGGKRHLGDRAIKTGQGI